MASNFIRRILIADAAETARPTAPARGSNISNVSGWFALGSRARGDDGDLDADRIELAMLDEYGHILPPVAMTKSDSVPMQNGLDSFEFVAYDVAKEVIELASDMVFTGQVGEKTLDSVKRSIVIEVNGLCYWYMPNVELKMTSLGAGIFNDGQAKTTFYADVCAGVDVPGGYQVVEYEA